MKKPIKILIAEDQEIVATGVRLILENSGGFDPINAVVNGLEVIEFLQSSEVDLILMDINMPLMDGIQCTRVIKDRFPKIKIIVLTMYNQKKFIHELIEVGADGCVLKSNSGKELLTAINRVMDNKTYFDHLNEFVDSSHDLKEFQLSDREIQIIQLISENFTSKEISERLFISEHTVKTHRKNIFKKTNVSDATELIQFAMNHNLI